MSKQISMMTEDRSHGEPKTFPAPHHRLGGPELYVFIILLLAFLVAAAVIKHMDYVWTLALGRHQVHWLTRIMGRTLFEGELPGGGDGPVVFLGISAILYTIAWLQPQRARLVRLRPYLGFIISTGFINAVLMVHGLKLALGRARPGLVIKEGLAYSHFYEFGPHYISEGIFRGSFPSGHTASVFTLMTIAYILLFNSRHSARLRLAGMCWGVLVLGYSVLMAVARSMSMSHWIGDGLLMILMSWLVLHVLYFWVLRIPAQTALRPASLQAVPMPRLWELRICWWLGWITLGLLATVIGARAFEEQAVPWLGVLIPPGLLLLVIAARRLHHLYRRVRVGFLVPTNTGHHAPGWKEKAANEQHEAPHPKGLAGL